MSSEPQHPREAQGSQGGPAYDNFYTPQNEDFYSSFAYIPLNRQFNGIRLLRVDISGKGDHKMIQNVPLDRASSYSALSYYSGDPKRTRKIFVDGIGFNAFENTVAALEETIRCWNALFPGQTLILWTDQICINQSDPSEKSHQVNFMREIYRRADRVFLSMLVSQDIKPAFQWLCRISDGVQEPPFTRAFPPETIQYGNEHGSGMSYSGKPRKDTETPLFVNLLYPAAEWDIFYDILEHPWWGRAWVYQEFITASRTIFLFSHGNWVDWEKLHPVLTHFLSLSVPQHVITCESRRSRAKQLAQPCCGYRFWAPILGSHKVQEAAVCPNECDIYCCFGMGLGFLLFVICLPIRIVWQIGDYISRRLDGDFRPGLQLAALVQHIARVQRESNARALVRHVIDSKRKWCNETVDLQYLIEHARNTQSSQEKDKVYAFLGLTHTDHDIRIDYNPSYTINAVLADTARSILMHEHSGINILLNAGTAVPNRRLTPANDTLPSWAPDWTIPETPIYHKFIESLNLPTDSDAGGQRTSVSSFEPDLFGNENRILVVDGVKVAVLNHVLRDSTYESWRTYSTSSGRLNITTTSIAQTGDEVWVIDGVKWPFVMRQERNGTRILLAPVMIHDSQNGAVSGYMYGRDWESGWQKETLSIS